MKGFLFWGTLFLLLSVQLAWAQVPQTISYQGVLTDASGAPMSGPHILAFRIYDVETGGAALWSEAHSVDLTTGLFNVVLGRTTPVKLPFDKRYWLGITIDTGAELSPRVAFTSSAYSLNARAVADSVVTGKKIARGQVVRGLNGLTDDVTITAGDNVTVTQQGKNIKISSTATAGDGNTLDEAYDEGGKGAGRTITADSGPVNIEGKDGLTVTGKVGIGTASPKSALDVAGAINQSATDPSTILFHHTNESGVPNDDGFRLRFDGEFLNNSNDALIIEKTDGNQNDPDGGIVIANTGKDGIVNPAIVIKGDGNVGIGTTSPATLLDVAGTARVIGFTLPTGAGAGLVLTSDAAGIATWKPPSGGFALPFMGTVSSTSDLFAVFQTGSGRAGFFQNSSTAANKAALEARTLGVGVGLSVNHLGPSGKIAEFLSADIEKMSVDKNGNLTLTGDVEIGNGKKISNDGGNQFLRLNNDQDGVDIRSTTNAAINIDSNNQGSDAFKVTFGSNRAIGLFMNQSGRVGIGTESPAERFSVSGVVQSTSGGFKFPDGTVQTTAAAPGTGDGHSLDAADGNPTDVVFVNNDGKVGVGTTTPNSILHVNSAATDAARIIISETGDNNDSHRSGVSLFDGVNFKGGIFKTGSSHDLVLWTSGNERMRIRQSSGNVGIGIESPAEKLSVSGIVQSTSGGFKFPDGTVQITAAAAGTGDGHSLDAADGNPTDVVFVNNDGKVGVGTTIPNSILHVNSAATDAARLVISETGDSDDSHRSGVSFFDGANFRGGIFKTGNSHDLVFWTSGNERLRIRQSSGNVGIGASNPSEKLDVNGTVQMTGFKLTTSTASGRVLTSDAAGVGTWQPLPAGLVPSWTLTGNSGTNPATNFLGTTDNQSMEIRVNNVRAFRLEPNATSPNVIGGFSGNGVTSSAFGASIGGGGSANKANIISKNFGVIGGGVNNKVDGVNATLGGGENNSAKGTSATVAGGTDNQADGEAAAIGGGDDNTADGDRATVPGGLRNSAQGDFTLAAGRRAKANHDGAFVWADNNDADFASTATDQFLIRATGGVGIGTNAPAQALDVSGSVHVSGSIFVGSTIVIDDTSITASNNTVSFADNHLKTSGVIESKLGGFKFPDGSIQITAAPGIAINPAWTALTLQLDFANVGLPWQTAQYRKIGDVVYLRGAVQKTDEVKAGDVIAILPVGSRPPADLTFMLPGVDKASIAFVAIAATGEIRIDNFIQKGRTMDLSAVQFSVRP